MGSSARRINHSSAVIQSLELRQLLASVGVDTTQVLRTTSTQMVGTNLTWWQGELNTAQMKQMVQAAGLKLFRLPGGSSADDNLHFNTPAPYNGYQTDQIIANFIQS